ncbi:50S ribosomal protein L1 [candidate division KSB1 bacterium]|nr:MAG: 50S ribosomal protein L1 [candidate division KSB1 bacterium]MBC6946933.1 50S ribosomal protein L1 [candidate division KSB1 bacterium]MCE7942316.1 50S ribosomal protein L1 [Chlorobi bacterium CHB1]MDL1875324.1 50S ribosomal protein L1 [Cytophagia bacterium CHB2]NUM73016.1 50S ribosomal protein L1 [candidate division KSB1 bacterium]
MNHSRRFRELAKLVEPNKEYSLEDAVALLKKTATAKFNETIEVAMRLGVDPRHADQVVRGTVSLPHGTGKTVRVLVLCKTVKEAEAREAGADHVGFDDFIKKINEGWFEFDVVIATPDVMGEVGKLGKVLGPRGLMPNPKSGTVTFDVGQAVKEVKAGKIEFRVDKSGILHVNIGKASFSEQQIAENARMFIETVVRLKPASSKGQYVRSITLSSTMGPGIPIDSNAMMGELKV